MAGQKEKGLGYRRRYGPPWGRVFDLLGGETGGPLYGPRNLLGEGGSLKKETGAEGKKKRNEGSRPLNQGGEERPWKGDGDKPRRTGLTKEGASREDTREGRGVWQNRD